VHISFFPRYLPGRFLLTVDKSGSGGALFSSVNMCKLAGAFFLVVMPVILAHPAKDELMFDLGDDTAVVESTVREARAVVPEHIEDLLQPGEWWAGKLPHQSKFASLSIMHCRTSRKLLQFRKRPFSTHLDFLAGTKQAYLHTFGDKEKDDGDVQGYHKKTQDKGSDGYKHFDSYHKKDGDKFGFEMHSEFGKSDKGGGEGAGKSGKYTEDYDRHGKLIITICIIQRII
jgi:hypothetical protein